MKQVSYGVQQVQEKRSEWALIQEAEAVRKARATHDRNQRDDELKANATAETLRHHKLCVADRMLLRDQLTPEQHRASREIARVFEAVTRALTSRISRYGEAGGGDCSNSFPPNLCVAHRDRYKPWAADQARLMVRGTTTRCDLVLSMSVDNYGARQIAERMHMDQRRIVGILRESLYRYAEMSGWLENPHHPVVLSQGLILSENAA